MILGVFVGVGEAHERLERWANDHVGAVIAIVVALCVLVAAVEKGSM